MYWGLNYNIGDARILGRGRFTPGLGPKDWSLPCHSKIRGFLTIKVRVTDRYVCVDCPKLLSIRGPIFRFLL